MLAVQRRASRDGRRLVVVRGCRAVERLFALSALDMRLEMVSLQRGVAAVAGVANPGRARASPQRAQRLQQRRYRSPRVIERTC